MTGRLAAFNLKGQHCSDIAFFFIVDPIYRHISKTLRQYVLPKLMTGVAKIANQYSKIDNPVFPKLLIGMILIFSLFQDFFENS